MTDASKPRRLNLAWERDKLAAKAGLYTRSAIGKKIAQKVRGRLKKVNDGVVPQADEVVHARIHSLEAERAKASQAFVDGGALSHPSPRTRIASRRRASSRASSCGKSARAALPR